MIPSMKITRVDVDDVRVPTSDSLLGSDPFHRKPDYSAVVVRITTDAGLEGHSVVFTIGAGTDWISYGVRDLSVLLIGRSLAEFIKQPAQLHQLMVEHHQLRWLADGVFRMSVGGLVNAMWDLWAKAEGKPLWELLTDLPAEMIVSCIDWRYLRDALSPEQAINLLHSREAGKADRKVDLMNRGPVAYSTSGWLGLSDEQISRHIQKLQQQGFRHFKTKVGGDLADDISRLKFLRSRLDDAALLMLDANQIWGVDEAIEWVQQLVQFQPYWIEEPTARDDVLGFIKIREAMKPHGIGVAAGEQVPSPTIFKQLLASGALSHCQIDATRLAGVNDVLAVILLAAHYDIPVCPHGGGIGLCNMIQHYSLWDQVAVSAKTEGRFVEYLDFLQQEVFETPVSVDNGCYVTPLAPGWGLEMKSAFIDKHRYPEGPLWSQRSDPHGPLFIA
ncbi:mandelate racemase/muconate lactonizing enzyme domain-containing protein [Chromatiales bacterium (ex Bugula neritina AB1)]|nr:mandelate racemase/muconate lactonizing enzyme domain-containing protein [Chromatiales bacterium (ex Bugula neritina AB1)]